MREEMTSRERVLTALQHKETDRNPISSGFNMNRPVAVQIQKYLKLKNVSDAYAYLADFSDLNFVIPKYIGPKERPDVNPFDLLMATNPVPYIDAWGVTYKPIKYGTGKNAGYYYEPTNPPFANTDSVDDVNNYLWPSPDWYDVKNFRDSLLQIDKNHEKATVITSIGKLFELSWSLTGFEKMFIDMSINTEFVWAIMEHVTDFFIAHYKSLLESADGLIDIVFTADDIAHQQGLMMSNDMWEKQLKPHHDRMNKFLHEYGVKILYHSDGAVMKSIPGLMDMGIDILDPLQFDAKDMDAVEMKKRFGDKLCFHGGISVQRTLPFGTVEDIRKEVMERIEVLGKDGGYLLGPSHAIQAGTPPENVIAMFETAKNYRRKT